MQKQNITPCLWFDNQAEEAVNFYISIFPNSTKGTVVHYDKNSANAAGMPEGSVLTVDFELNGQKFIALNGGPAFKFSEAISFMVYCDTQEELDRIWEKLSAVPESEQCGWLKDKYGLSWQIVPTQLSQWMSDPAKWGPVMKAVLSMKKLDIAELKKAYEGK